MKLLVNKTGKMLFVLSFLLSTITAFAQQIIVKGVVTDENHEPLVGVSVIGGKSKARIRARFTASA